MSDETKKPEEKKPDEQKKPVEEAQTKPVSTEPEGTTASAKIREEARSVIKQLAEQGKDPMNKDVYPELVRNLGKKYGVGYSTAFKAWSRVLREIGVAPPIVPTKSATVGGVRAEVKARPKAGEETPPPVAKKIGGKGSSLVICENCQTPNDTLAKYCFNCGNALQIGLPEPVTLSDDELDEMMSATFELPTRALYKMIETAWGVKIEEVEQEDFDRLGRTWGKVIRTYGQEVPKIFLLLSAIMTTGTTLGLPVLVARGQAVERARQEYDKAEKERAKTSLPKLDTFANREGLDRV